MSKNSNLHSAKKAKNDEFYTQIEDIEKELIHYIKHFKDKVVFCNCDDPESSNFWKYFKLNFKVLGLKKLISTHYIKDKKSYKLEFDGTTVNKSKLKGDGDFRSDECVEILKTADIVVTNPPFSLSREYIIQLIEYKKKFLIIGALNNVKYKDIFPLIKESKLWMGLNSVKSFKRLDGYIQTFGNIYWYTNLKINKKNKLVLNNRLYNKKDYPKYDNYDAIEVGKISNIPIDYEGVMGVPISYLTKHDADLYEIIGELNHGSDNKYDFAKPIINNQELYPRILIKRL